MVQGKKESVSNDERGGAAQNNRQIPSQEKVAFWIKD